MKSFGHFWYKLIISYRAGTNLRIIWVWIWSKDGTRVFNWLFLIPSFYTYKPQRKKGQISVTKGQFEDIPCKVIRSGRERSGQIRSNWKLWKTRGYTTQVISVQPKSSTKKISGQNKNIVSLHLALKSHRFLTVIFRSNYKRLNRSFTGRLV